MSKRKAGSKSKNQPQEVPEVPQETVEDLRLQITALQGQVVDFTVQVAASLAIRVELQNRVDNLELDLAAAAQQVPVPAANNHGLTVARLTEELRKVAREHKLCHQDNKKTKRCNGFYVNEKRQTCNGTGNNTYYYCKKCSPSPQNLYALCITNNCHAFHLIDQFSDKVIELINAPGTESDNDAEVDDNDIEEKDDE